MNLDLGFVEQINQLPSQISKSLELNNSCLILSKHYQSPETCLPRELIGKSVTENLDNLADLLLSKELVGH